MDDPLEITVDDVVDIISAYATESEYIIANIFGILHLYTGYSWDMDSIEYNKTTKTLVYTFAPDDEDVDVKVFIMDPLRVIDQDYIDDLLRQFAVEVGGFHANQYNITIQ